MYVSSILIDRFGRRSRFQLDSLSDGLNLVTGPAGSGKTTVVDFLRAIWTGFDSALRSRYLPPESRGFGGEITILTPQGKQKVSRYDDGGVDGHLTVERADGAVIGRRHVQDLLGNLSTELFDRAFLVDFQRRLQLADLLRAVDRHGISRERPRTDAGAAGLDRRLSEIRDGLSRLPPSDVYDSLLQRRRELEGRLSLASRVPVAQPAELKTRATGMPGRMRLMRLDSQLARWRRTMRELARKRLRAAEQMERSSSAVLPGGMSRARGHLSALESQLLAHQATLEQAISAGAPAPQIAAMRESLAKMRTDVYQLCDELTRLRANRRYRRALLRHDQFERCEAELRLAIKDLVRRRRAMLRRLGVSELGSSGVLGSTEDCRCSQHHASDQFGPSLFRPVERASDSPTVDGIPFSDARGLRTELEAVDRKLADLERRRQLVAESERLESERARLSRADGNQGLAARANEYLRRLSSGAWCEVRAASLEEIQLVDSQGRAFEYRSLDDGSRDQAYLAWSLAIAAESRRLGTKLPLVLNDVFAHYPSKQVRDSLEFLREFGRDHQILCLTRHEHVASVARLLNIPIHVLAESDRSVRSQPTEVPSRGFAEPRALHAAQYDARAELWDADAHRGIVAPLPSRETRLTPVVAPAPAPAPAAPAAPRPAAPPRPQSEPSDYFLHEQDPIERAPSLDEHTANRLRAIGVPWVGDLLRIPSPEIATEMGTGVNPEMVRAWQSQARLMCQIRGLRPYDARILVACGIDHPHQLMQLSGSELRSRVKEFTASPEGQAILLSGTESELSRVSDWLRGSLDRQGREVPLGDRFSRTTGEQDSAGDRQVRIDDPHAERRETRGRRDRNDHRDNQERSRERRGSRRQNDGVVAIPATESAARFYLRRSSPVADAPTIGPSLARRLEKVGVTAVEDLLSQDAGAIAAALQMSRVTADTVRQWQKQAELVCRVPKLRGHDAQILVAAGIGDVAELATARPDELWERVRAYAESLDGKRAIRAGTEPDAKEVLTWIEWAQQARTLQAA